MVSLDGWIAVCTLASPGLAEEIAFRKPEGVCLTGKTETENIGIEKVVRNTIALSAISYLIICGQESEGHYSGDGLISLVKNGVDDNMRIIGAKGKKCILKNIDPDEIEAFKNNIEVIDMIGCDDIESIVNQIENLKYKEDNKRMNFASKNKMEVVVAVEKDPYKVKLDKLGYFVILPQKENGKIVVEHYGNDNSLLHIIEGDSARNIYWTIIERGWISELSHCAYLGKELARAELSLEYGFSYIQDKA
jgi:tetrahydromethanopterin S-methyltransferase subunit A